MRLSRTYRIVLLGGFLGIILISRPLLMADVGTHAADDPQAFLRARMGLVTGQCPTLAHRIIWWTDMLQAQHMNDNAFDANNNGVVNAEDATILLTALLNLQSTCGTSSTPPPPAECLNDETTEQVPHACQAFTFHDNTMMFTEMDRKRAAAAYYPVMLSHQCKTYVAWNEGLSRMRVAVFNNDPSRPQWNYIDDIGWLTMNRQQSSQAPALFVFQDKIHIAWVEKDSSNNLRAVLRVSVYNGNDENPQWIPVDHGGIGYGAIAMDHLRPIVIENRLFLLWIDNGTIRIVRYNGANSLISNNIWSFIDGGGIGTRIRSFSVVEHDKKLLVGYNRWTALNDDSPENGGMVIVDGWNPIQGVLWDPERAVFERNRTIHDMALFNGTVHLLATKWESESSNELQLLEFNGNTQAPDWARVGGPYRLNALNSNALAGRIATTNDSILITWTENGEQPVQRQRVALYTESDTVDGWKYLDRGHDAGGLSMHPERSTREAGIITQQAGAYLFWIEPNDLGVGTLNIMRNDCGTECHDQCVWTGCGDGIRQQGEECDDGNQTNGDGCSESCTLESGFQCDTSPGTKTSCRVEAATFYGDRYLPDLPHVTSYALTEMQGHLYTIWRDTTGDHSEIRMHTYDTDNPAAGWQNLGLMPSVISSNAQSNPILTVFENKLYAAWTERINDNDHIRVAVYNGNDPTPDWALVDGTQEGLGHAGSANPNMAVASGILYLAWEEPPITGKQWNRAMVARYNGNDTAPMWESIVQNGHDTLRKSPTGSFAPHLMAVNGQLHAAWLENVMQGNDRIPHVRVGRYDGGQSEWTIMSSASNGLNVDPTKHASSPRLVTFGNRWLVSWQEGGTGFANTKEYVGIDPLQTWSDVNWALLDAHELFSEPYGSSVPSFIESRGNLYAFWTENRVYLGAPRVRGAVLRNDRWTPVDRGRNGINRNQFSGHHVQVVESNERLYTAWLEDIPQEYVYGDQTPIVRNLWVLQEDCMRCSRPPEGYRYVGSTCDFCGTPTSVSGCGNGILDIRGSIEECDDGNNEDGDGCNHLCMLEYDILCESNTDCPTGYRCNNADENRCLQGRGSCSPYEPCRRHPNGYSAKQDICFGGCVPIQ